MYIWMRIEVKIHPVITASKTNCAYNERVCGVAGNNKGVYFLYCCNCLSWVIQWRDYPGKHLSTMYHRNVASHTEYLAHFPAKPQRSMYSLTSGKCVDGFGDRFGLAVLPLNLSKPYRSNFITTPTESNYWSSCVALSLRSPSELLPVTSCSCPGSLRKKKNRIDDPTWLTTKDGSQI